MSAMAELDMFIAQQLDRRVPADQIAADIAYEYSIDFEQALVLVETYAEASLEDSV